MARIVRIVGILYIAVAFIAIVLWAGALDTPPHKANYPACQYEDGNTDGKPCIWTDPDTGRQIYVDSANYR